MTLTHTIFPTRDRVRHEKMTDRTLGIVYEYFRDKYGVMVTILSGKHPFIFFDTEASELWRGLREAV